MPAFAGLNKQQTHSWKFGPGSSNTAHCDYWLPHATLKGHIMHLNLSRFPLLAALLSSFVYANTEIINFSAPQYPTPLRATSNWPVLSRSLAEGAFNISGAPYGVSLQEACQSALHAQRPTRAMCPYELWLVLDLSDRKWASFSKFTLRASWPASFPADIDIKLHDSDTLIESFPEPCPCQLRMAWMNTDPTCSGVLDLEPLYFGVLPASLAPTVAFVVAVVVLCGLWLPRINGFISRAAQQAKTEVASKHKHD
ncbi:hypothetical protein BD779DRAFT_1488287 [Infundibulicybe gibba]|nr:hypothetical protein BD779DRAFT_1488287 [Infundibulicybe gibba]